MDAAGQGRGLPQPPLAVFLVVRIVPLEEAHPALALEGQDVRGHAVEEPPVVADDDAAAGEGGEGLLQRAQGVDVQVVGGLI